jgi:signal transduction histidine kinase
LIRINAAAMQVSYDRSSEAMHLIHDLRLVLAAIAACLETLKERTEGSPVPQEFDHIRRFLDTGFSVADELLVSPTLPPPASLVDVNALLENIDAAMGSVAGADVSVRTKLGAMDSRVYGRAVDIERMLLNVVFNAIAAMPSGGGLSIETAVTQSTTGEAWTGAAAPFGNLRLTLRDTGRGMSDAELAAIMNPLARPRQDGTGLGLASVLLILTRLGGTITIDSRPDGGTEVAISLPLAPAAGTQIH